MSPARRAGSRGLRPSGAAGDATGDAPLRSGRPRCPPIRAPRARTLNSRFALGSPHTAPLLRRFPRRQREKRLRARFRDTRLDPSMRWRSRFSDSQKLSRQLDVQDFYPSTPYPRRGTLRQCFATAGHAPTTDGAFVIPLRWRDHLAVTHGNNFTVIRLNTPRVHQDRSR